MPLKLLPLHSIQEVLQWYENNLCNVELRDPRGYRVRFKPEHFIHLVTLTTKYGEEPRNRRLAVEEIKSGKIQFVDGRYDVAARLRTTLGRGIGEEPRVYLSELASIGKWR
jgi:hypothetical protein